MELYSWQEKALNEENDYAMWCCEAGTGKTFGAKLWLKQKDRMKNPVVLCPKQIREDWKETVEHVYTPYEVRTKTLPKNPSAIVVDEADEYASPLFLATKRSKMSEKLYEYIKANPDVPVLLLTATPIRSTPWNIHTLLTYIHHYIDWKTYRKNFFFLETPRWGTRPTWFPQHGWQKRMQPLLEKYAKIALMKDMVDYLPPETHKIIKLKEPNYEKNTEWEASKQFVEDHRLEQCGKVKEVSKISKQYRKVVVVAHYRSHIDELYKRLSKERQTFVLRGGTKDVERVIADAEDSSECYFILQNSIAAGFELPSFTCMIFTNMGYGVRNYVQCKARIRRINALKPVIYYNLIGGRCDQMVYDSVMAGKDFVPSCYMVD